MIQALPDPAPLSDHQILESDTESDSSGLDLVKLAQPPTRSPSPGQSAVRLPQQPIVPPPVPWCTTPLPDVETAPPHVPTPQYSLRPTRDHLARGSQAGPSTESINHLMIHMLEEVPNSYQEVMNSLERDKWLKAS